MLRERRLLCTVAREPAAFVENWAVYGGSGHKRMTLSPASIKRRVAGGLGVRLRAATGLDNGVLASAFAGRSCGRDEHLLVPRMGLCNMCMSLWHISTFCLFAVVCMRMAFS